MIPTKPHRRHLWLRRSLWILWLLILVACSSQAEPTQPQIEQVEPEVAVAATATPIPQPPPIREALAATDPATVQLASGQVQLIEAFAYW